MTSGKASRDQRAAKVKAQQAAMRKAEARRRNGIIAGAVVAVLVVVVGIGAIVQAGRNSTSDSSANPANTSGTSNQTVAVVGKADAPVTVIAYEDFMCPVCGEFEKQAGAALKQFVADGKVKVEYRSISFLDRASTTSYSTRALNSVGCLVDAKPSAFAEYHDLLFANQPEEGGAGLPDSKLISMAKEAGVTGIDSCVKDQKFKGWTQRVTDQSSKDGVNGTPTVIVNGKNVDQAWVGDNTKKAIEAALAG
jgi:protein-disulfide isomerase